ncbi:hypothetical protein HELRODRAFT_158518 [Helobdella robusta]|uniref:Uncharacterized protein n=1 Tax=Helobdella robusta TaxID=6412 RepID=T1EMW5_HELRO|nr:hypothetical protein HELRODRAFT_158518 [Helobdella robusta]ESO12097.1 hypothetical protein HELRODRAFT_158518 [Helobdella robusta]
MSAFSWIFSSTQTRRNRCNKHEMWLVAKNSSLLSLDLTLIILHIALRNLRVLGSIGPRTSIHIGKNSIEGRAFPYFFIFSSAALAAAKPHSLLVSESHFTCAIYYPPKNLSYKDSSLMGYIDELSNTVLGSDSKLIIGVTSINSTRLRLTL